MDLHADLLWRTAETGKDPWRVLDGEMLDLPRMLEDGPSVQLLTLYTPACYGLLERGLRDRGWSRAHVDAVLGGNALRVLGEVLR